MPLGCDGRRSARGGAAVRGGSRGSSARVVGRRSTPHARRHPSASGCSRAFAAARCTRISTGAHTERTEWIGRSSSISTRTHPLRRALFFGSLHGLGGSALLGYSPLAAPTRVRRSRYAAVLRVSEPPRACSCCRRRFHCRCALAVCAQRHSEDRLVASSLWRRSRSALGSVRARHPDRSGTARNLTQILEGAVAARAVRGHDPNHPDGPISRRFRAVRGIRRSAIERPSDRNPHPRHPRNDRRRRERGEARPVLTAQRRELRDRG